ncbi:MAG: hypothetical protein IT577_14600 [Verrucomicrobiae bacterium]|nr:hypothetical protein [Verrucomicrobiae bacterium]
MKTNPSNLILAALIGLLPCPSWSEDASPAPGGDRARHVLFIGNSFTARHNLSQVVKAMAEAGQPGLRFEVTTVIYGGRTLKDHWRLGTQNFVRLASLTAPEEQATIQALRDAIAKDPGDKYAPPALARHLELAKTLDQPRPKWDIVVLQSYRDDQPGAQAPYHEYAPRFAELIRGQGARVVLYETTPDSQNDKPLTAPPDPAPVLAKERAIASLAKRIGATVVPMSMVALHCQTARPDLTLRFVNDAHLNQTMAYLTACTFYGALFDRSPEGLPVDAVTDIRWLDDRHRDKDRDGGPITRTFSAKDRADLQRIAWEGLKKFHELAPDGRDRGP